MGGIKKRGLKTSRKLGETVFFCTYKLQKIIPINNDQKNNKIPSAVYGS